MRWHPQAELKKNENAVRARAFRSRCQLHRKRESQHDVNGYCQRVADCIIRSVVPQLTEREHIGNQINAAMVFTGTDFVNVL